MNAEYHISLSSELEMTVLSSWPHSATLIADVCPLSSSTTEEETCRRGARMIKGWDGMGGE